MDEPTSVERWLPIPHLAGYEASDQGRVRSVDRVLIVGAAGVRVPRRGKVLTPSRGQKPTRHRYWSVRIECTMHSVHCLVLAAFVGPRPAGALGCHRNDDMDDNRLENLYWGTHGDNLRDAYRNGKRRKRTPRSSTCNP